MSLVYFITHPDVVIDPNVRVPQWPLSARGKERMKKMMMYLEQKIASLFRMTDEVWARHANPWSVWTRYLALPVLIFSIWSGRLFLVWLLLYLVRAGSSTVWSGCATK